ncbi:hypothetical protein D3C78_1293890 [compost metagenome]
MLQPAFEARIDRALEGDLFLAQAHGLLRRTPGQALLRGPPKRRLPAQFVKRRGVQVEVIRPLIGLERVDDQQVRKRFHRLRDRRHVAGKPFRGEDVAQCSIGLAGHLVERRAKPVDLFGQRGKVLIKLCQRPLGLVVEAGHLADLGLCRVDRTLQTAGLVAQVFADKGQAFDGIRRTADFIQRAIHGPGHRLQVGASGLAGINHVLQPAL